MSWKNSSLYFHYQILKFAQKWSDISLFRKYYKKWRLSLEKGQSSVRDESAWLSFEALEYLDNWLNKTHKVFEYGGGGSTLFFAKRAGFVATVEHDTGWFDLLTLEMKNKGYSHWEGFGVPGKPRTDPNKKVSPAIPGDFASTSKGYENQSFEDYVKTIHRYPAGHFDLVLVDGRSRASCMEAAIEHIKPGGLLILDNADRKWYTRFFYEQHSKEFEFVQGDFWPAPYTAEFIITMILRKK